MADYYLISQLPSLDGISENAPVPITEERFLDLCDRLLSKKARKELKNLTLMPPRTHKKSSSSVIDAWNTGERNLRYVLGKIRADKMKKPFDLENHSTSADLVRAATAATEFESPMEAEKYLNQYRLGFLESIRPLDAFSEEYVFYYGLKLKLLQHMRQFDVDAGEAAYKNIYDSILDGDRMEAM